MIIPILTLTTILPTWKPGKGFNGFAHIKMRPTYGNRYVPVAMQEVTEFFLSHLFATLISLPLILVTFNTPFFIPALILAPLAAWNLRKLPILNRELEFWGHSMEEHVALTSYPNPYYDRIEQQLINSYPHLHIKKFHRRPVKLLRKILAPHERKAEKEYAKSQS